MTPGILAIVSLVVGVFPLLIAITATVIAKICGCRLDEGDAHPCVIFGRDRGEMLYTLFNFFWLMFFTMPLGGAGLIGAGIWALWS